MDEKREDLKLATFNARHSNMFTNSINELNNSLDKN